MRNFFIISILSTFLTISCGFEGHDSNYEGYESSERSPKGPSRPKEPSSPKDPTESDEFAYVKKIYPNVTFIKKTGKTLPSSGSQTINGTIKTSALKLSVKTLSGKGEILVSTGEFITKNFEFSGTIDCSEKCLISTSTNPEKISTKLIGKFTYEYVEQG